MGVLETRRTVRTRLLMMSRSVARLVTQSLPPPLLLPLDNKTISSRNAFNSPRSLRRTFPSHRDLNTRSHPGSADETITTLGAITPDLLWMRTMRRRERIVPTRIRTSRRKMFLEGVDGEVQVASDGARGFCTSLPRLLPLPQHQHLLPSLLLVSAEGSTRLMRSLMSRLLRRGRARALDCLALRFRLSLCLGDEANFLRRRRRHSKRG